MQNTKNLIVLCGFMGCGKTTLGKALAKRLGYAFADTDDMLLAGAGTTLAGIFAAGGESLFRELEHETVRKAAALQNTVLSTGGGVMTFARNAQLLAQSGEIIHIRRSFDACCSAVLQRKNRPIAGTKTRGELLSIYEARLAAYEQHAVFTVCNDGAIDDAVEQILTHLRSRAGTEGIPNTSDP